MRTPEPIEHPQQSAIDLSTNLTLRTQTDHDFSSQRSDPRSNSPLAMSLTPSPTFGHPQKRKAKEPRSLQQRLKAGLLPPETVDRFVTVANEVEDPVVEKVSVE